MNRRIALVLAALLLSGAAQAQLFRAYLAPSGNDANPCTLPLPCRLLPAALSAVADGGEIWMLDSANYNTAVVNIFKSVTILAVPGAVGSVVATGSAPAIGISSPGAKVTLRNLVIGPLPGTDPQSGIVVSDAASLTVEGCVVANLPSTGILVFVPATVRIVDTIVRDNGTGIDIQGGARASITRTVVSGHAFGGIYVLSSQPGVTSSADVTDSTMEGNSTGLNVTSFASTARAIVTVRNSLVTGNTTGLFAEALGGTASLVASGNVVSHGGKGIRTVGSGARAWVRGNTVTQNTVGLAQESSSSFESAGDNTVHGNAIQGAGSILLTSPQ